MINSKQYDKALEKLDFIIDFNLSLIAKSDGFVPRHDLQLAN
ncbi:MAG TPA: hypothetical protein VKT28_17070 [Puia sp.]|nr:hypothetical protein [Puia sp.]